jgi:hypothetical protein
MVAVVAAVVVVRARVGRRSDEVVTRIDECRSACKVVDV